MANIKIGHVELTVDPDSFVINDFKNNTVVPAIRNGTPQSIPTGSSNFDVQFSVVFPNQNDVNQKLRPLLALHSGLPFVNVQSDILSNIFIASLQSEEAVKEIEAHLAQIEKDRTDFLGDSEEQTKNLLAIAIADSVFYPSFVYAATRQICISGIKAYLDMRDDDNNTKLDLILDQEPPSAARALIKNIKRYYEAVINEYNKTANKKCNVANSETLEKLVEQFILCAVTDTAAQQGDTPGLLDAGRRDVESIKNETFGNEAVKDGDSIKLADGEELRTVGIDAYETTHDDLPGQEWYDKSATSFNNSIAQTSRFFWYDSGTVIVKRYGEGFYGRTLAELFSGDTNLNAQSVLLGFTFPMAISNAGSAGFKDKIYVDNAFNASDNNLLVWNTNYTLPDIYSAGYNEETGIAYLGSDGDQARIVLPKDFRETKNSSALRTYKLPSGDVSMSSPSVSSDGSHSFRTATADFRIANTGTSAAPVTLRILEPTSFNAMINDHFYFYSEHKNATSFASINSLYQDDDNTGNANKLNALLGPENLEDYGKAVPHDYIHLYATFSTVPVGRNVFEYKDSGGIWKATTKSTDVVPSQIIQAKSITLAEARRRLDTVNTVIGFSTPANYHDDTQYEKIRSILASYKREEFATKQAEHQSQRSVTDESVKNLVVVKYPGNWIPMAFKAISLSTVPNMPEALHCTMSFSFFNHIPFTPRFGYIPTVDPSTQQAVGLTGLNRRYDVHEPDLVRTPVVTNWLEKTYLTEDSNPQKRFLPYNVLGGNVPLIFSYTFPVLAYTSQRDIEKSSFTKTSQMIQLKMHAGREPEALHANDIYDVHVEDVNYYTANNIKTIPLQGAEVPVAQYLGRANNYMTITLSTNNLRSIEGLRKVDKLMQDIARSVFHELFPVKIQVLHPVANIFGNKTFILQRVSVSNKPSATGWYTIKVDLVESGGGRTNSENLDLVRLPNVFHASNLTQEDIAEVLMDVLFNKEAHSAVSDRVWRMLIGPNHNFSKVEDSDRIKEIPLFLQYINPDPKDLFHITIDAAPIVFSSTGDYNIRNTATEILKILRDEDGTITATDASIAVSQGGPIAKIIADLNPFDDNKENRAKWNGLMKLMQFAGIIGYKDKRSKLFKITPDRYVSEMQENALRSITQLEPLGVNNRVDIGGDTRRALLDITSAHIKRLITKTDVNPNISRSEVGLMGRFKIEGKEDQFISDRIAFYNDEELNFNELTILNKGLASIFESIERSTEGNLLAYTIYKLSGLLYDNKDVPAVRETVKTMLYNALEIATYKQHISAVVAVGSLDDAALQLLYKNVQNRQTVYEDLDLPRYNDIYGQLGSSDVDVSSLVNNVSLLYASSLKLGVPEIQTEVENMRRSIKFGDEEVFLVDLYRKNKNSILENTLKPAQNIKQFATNELERVGQTIAVSQKARERTNKAINKVINLADRVIADINKIKQTPNISRDKIYTEIENLPTYAELGTPPPINKFGIRDVNALARDGNDLMEPGWQYYSPFGVDRHQKPSITVKRHTSPSYVVDPVIKTTEMATNESTFHKNKNKPLKQNTLSFSHWEQIYETGIQYNDAVALEEIGKQAEEIREYKANIRTQVNKRNREANKLRVMSGVDSSYSSQKQTILPTLKDRHANDIDTFSKKYMQNMSHLRRIHKGSRIYDMRRAFPGVQLYFLQENSAIFQDWSKFYNYDSIISISVVHEKEAVSGAIIELTNFSGTLTNEPDFHKLKINPRDVIKGDQVTTTLVEKPGYVIGEKGEIVSSGKLSESSIGDVIAFQLKPGIRIQVRAGYASVDNENPVIFTGQVAEVQPGKVVRIIAQGYDYQLMRHLEDSWTGSFNAFPTIITDMLHYTEYFGKWEPYQYSRAWAPTDKKNERKSSSRDHLKAQGWFRSEVLFGINDTCNDNLYNLKNHGTSPNLLNPFNLVQGQKWFCNGPILENIYSMRRYIPNYAIAVKPYDERATLYFGPKEGTYVYTSRVTRDMVKFNRLHNFKYIASETNQLIRDTYYSPQFVLNNLIKGAPSPHDIAGTEDEISLAMIKRDKIKTLDLTDAAYGLSNIDVARCFLRVWALYARGALTERIEKGDLYGRDIRSFIELHASIEYDNITVQDIVEGGLGSGKTGSLGNFLIDSPGVLRKTGADKMFHTVYSSPKHDTYSEIMQTIVDRLVKKEGQPVESRFLGIPQYVVGVDFYDFAKGLNALGNPISNDMASAIFGNSIQIPGGRFKMTAEEIGRNLKAIYKKLDEVIQEVKRIDTAVKKERSELGIIDRALERMMTEQQYRIPEIDMPILYFAMIQATSARAIEYTGYLSFSSLVAIAHSKSSKDQRLYKEHGKFVYQTYHKVLATSWISKIKDSNKPSRGEQMIASDNLVRNDIGPNRKPFRDYHIVGDQDIITNNIIASKSHMANSVTLWTPKKSTEAGDPESSLGAGSLTRASVSFSPILQDDIPVTVFDRNAEESYWFGAKTYQVAMGYLGDYLREMYQGDVTTLGRPEINPYDIVTMQDNTRDLRGNFEVKRVVHSYNSQTGFTTTITPHLLTYVNEDVESARVLAQSLVEFGIFAVGAGLVLASGGLFAGIGGFALVATGALTAGYAYNSARKRSGQTSSFVGIPFPTISAVGYSNGFFDSKGPSVRRNPCRIQPMEYKGEPLVAGLDGFEKQDWTNQQAEDILESDYQLGKQQIGLQIKRGIMSWRKSWSEMLSATREASQQLPE